MGYKLNLFGAIAIIFLAKYFYNKSFNEEEAEERIIGLSPIISTSLGKLQGLEALSRDGNQFYSYRGIPYAKSPIGNLRYEPPVESESWTGTLTANKFGNECAQYNSFMSVISGDEDCLFLNVFVPKSVSEGAKSVPVMVFIHGGYFMFGSANTFGPEYFMDHNDIVLVSLNYRLASLGFLNTNDAVVRGNMGLKDQAMALAWVQKNIKYFNGDSNSVTIFGISAGGASVHYQVLSPTTKGLFHRAIPMSGSALNAWALTTNPEIQAKRHAERVGCERSTTSEMIKCLKDLPVEKILESHQELGFRGGFRDPKLVIFTPTIEGVIKDDKSSFVPKHPFETLKSGNFNPIPIMIGYNSHEGLFEAPGSNKAVLRAFNENFTQVAPNYIFHPTHDKSSQPLNKEMEEIRSYYFGANNEPIDDHMAKLQNYTNLITDSMFSVGVHKSIREHSKTAPVYAYYFAYKGQSSTAKMLLALKGEYHPLIELGLEWMKDLINKYIFGAESVHLGASHGDDLGLFFKMPSWGMSTINQGDKDYAMSKDMVKLYISFAKGESPLTFRNQVWPKIEANPKLLSFLRIDEVASILENPDHERVQFLSKYHFK